MLNSLAKTFVPDGKQKAKIFWIHFWKVIKYS